MCGFLGLTSIFLKNSSQIHINNLKIGMVLEDDSKIICLQKMINYHPLYLYKNRVYLSGESKVIENGHSIYIKDSTLSVETSCKPEFIYGISTSSSIISIRGLTFIDYSQSRNVFINKTINSLILSLWNNGKEESDNFSKGVVFLEHGFGGNTKFKMADGTFKKIHNLEIGDILENKNPIIGKIELDPNMFLFYDFCGVVATSNTKVYDDIVWKNIEYAQYTEPIVKPIKAFNIITKKGLIKCKNNYFLDYAEVKNDMIAGEIEKLLDLGFHFNKDNDLVIQNTI